MHCGPSSRAVKVGSALAAALLVASVAAQDLSGLTGTIGVEASRLQKSGRFAGCTVNFRAVVQDHLYRKGALVAVVGSFSLNVMEMRGEKTVGPLLKVGLKQMLPPGQDRFESPAFAYLQSDSGTTAKSVFGGDMSDTPGFRVFALKLDDGVAKIIGDILEGAPVSLYFSRSNDGLDVRVPLDFRVLDSRSSGTGIVPIRSEETLRTFRQCFDDVVKEIK